jgi:putative ABC transport system permease protein
MVAVLLAVAALTAVGFFADRLKRLARDAGALLGGDAVVASDKPPPPELVPSARRALGLRRPPAPAFRAWRGRRRARGGDAPGVGEGGERRLPAARPAAPARRADGGRGAVAARPAPARCGSTRPCWTRCSWAWATSCCSATPGCESPRLIVSRARPRRRLHGFAPRVLLNEADLAATGLIQPASRVTTGWRWPHERAAPSAACATSCAWAEARIEPCPARRARGVAAERRPEMQQTLDRAGKFLDLVALLAALLAAVAVAIAARDFAQRHLDDCALLRVLGLPQRRIAWAYALEFAGVVGLLASVGGVLLALAVHGVFVWLLSGLLGAATAAARPLAGAVRAGRGHDPAGRPSACRRCCSWRACRRCG